MKGYPTTPDGRYFVVRGRFRSGILYVVNGDPQHFRGLANHIELFDTGRCEIDRLLKFDYNVVSVRNPLHHEVIRRVLMDQGENLLATDEPFGNTKDRLIDLQVVVATLVDGHEMLAAGGVEVEFLCEFNELLGITRDTERYFEVVRGLADQFQKLLASDDVVFDGVLDSIDLQVEVVNRISVHLISSQGTYNK